MPLPSGVATCTLTVGVDVDPTGDPVAATLTLTPVVVRGSVPVPVGLVHTTSGTAIVPLPESVTVTSSGPAQTIVLPRTTNSTLVDAATNQPADWVYLADIVYESARRTWKQAKAFRLAAASADLDSVSPVPLQPAASPLPTPVPHDHQDLYPSRQEITNLISGITGVDVSGVVTVMGNVVSGTDLDTLTAQGIYPIPYSASANYTLANDPGTLAGSVWVVDHRSPTGNMRTQIRMESTGGGVFVRSSNSAGAYLPWRRLHDYADDHLSPASARREVVVAAGLRRRGGVVGTGGRPAVALRFDHHLIPFRDKVLPLLRQHQLPWGQMLNPGNIGSGNDNVPLATIASWCHSAGGEVWNHSQRHVSVTSESMAEREITTALADLRGQFPGLWIDGWAPPGTSGDTYLGAEGWDTPDKMWQASPSRRVLAQHAFSRGYYPGVHDQLCGPSSLIGASHITIDAQTQAWVEAAVRAVLDTRMGLTLMLHPNYLDQSGYLTTTALSGILAYIAGRRDAGELEVLTPTAIMMADADRPRASMLFSGPEPGGIPAGGWSQAVLSRSYLPLLGVPHELGATLSGSGQATLTITVTTPGGTITSTRTRVLTSTPTRHAVVATPPLDATGITVAITATGTAQHLGITYRPI